MAKPVRKPQPTPKRTPASASATVASADLQLPAFFNNLKLPALLVFGFAFLLYANTLSHGFVLDDAIVITDNMYTQKGVEGIPGILSKDTFYGFFKEAGKDKLVTGGRYRPFSLVIFALLYQIAGSSAFAFHLLTVLLFAATCATLFFALQYMLAPRFGKGYATLLSLLTAGLFAAHPIHTEVVANIKGCDEIITLLLCFGALWLVFRAYDTGRTALAWIAGLVYFFACMSKENAATFVVIAPLALWFFRSREKTAGPSILGLSLPLWLAFGVFFVIRGNILHWQLGGVSSEWMNNPFLKLEGNQWVAYSAGEKLATVLYTLLKYIFLLIFPHPLTHDYYPKQITMQTFGSPMVLLSLLVYGALGLIALRSLKKKDLIGFGVLYFLLTLSIVSNLAFPVGTSMGERFVFMPSVGFCLVVSVLLLQLIRTPQGWLSEKIKLPLILGGILAALFGLKTLVRNPVWASNERLFFEDAKTSVNSAKIQSAMSGISFDKAKPEKPGPLRDSLFRESIKYADRSLKIHPTYKDPLLSRSGAYYYLGQYEEAIAGYKNAILVAPEDKKIPQYLALVMRDAGQYYGEKQGNLDKALGYFNESWKLNDQDPQTARLMGVALGIKAQMETAKGNAAQALPLNREALGWFQKAIALAPKEASYYFDLGTAYYNLGDRVQANTYHQKAMEMDPKLRQRYEGKK